MQKNCFHVRSAVQITLLSCHLELNLTSLIAAKGLSSTSTISATSLSLSWIMSTAAGMPGQSMDSCSHASARVYAPALTLRGTQICSEKQTHTDTHTHTPREQSSLSNDLSHLAAGTDMLSMAPPSHKLPVNLLQVCNTPTWQCAP